MTTSNKASGDERENVVNDLMMMFGYQSMIHPRTFRYGMYKGNDGKLHIQYKNGKPVIWSKDNDFYTVGDVMAVSDYDTVIIQSTDSVHAKTRRDKIDKAFKVNNPHLKVEQWSTDISKRLINGYHRKYYDISVHRRINVGEWYNYCKFGAWYEKGEIRTTDGLWEYLKIDDILKRNGL